MAHEDNLFWSITGSWIFLGFLYAFCLLYLFISSDFTSIDILPSQDKLKNFSVSEILFIASFTAFLFYAQLRNILTRNPR
ncbi:MAG: hypothetical protein PHI97_33455 [Desulfobulbus sp.]|nr:hypothetical protein [Desulfobulbus sp.]